MSIEEQIAAFTQSLEAQVAASVTQNQSPYIAASATFGTGAVVATNKYGYAQNDQGWWRSEEGAIVDPSAGPDGVLFPPPSADVDPSTIPGSPQWLAKIQDEWTDEKANKWRQQLWSQGYQAVGLQSDKGGMAHDLVEALKEYHYRRYLSGGSVTPIAPLQDMGADKVRLKDVYDPVALKDDIKAWGQIPFGEDLADDEANYFADRVLDVAQRLMKDKGWEAGRALEGAGLRVSKQFEKAPGVKGAIQDVEEDEMDESLRESIVSISQLGGV